MTDWVPRVPDLSRPPGADIDADGFVRCVTCGARVDVMSADVVGEGYQCATCTALAPAPDPYAFLPSAGMLALAGVLLSVATALLWQLRVSNPPIHEHYHSRGVPLPIWAGALAAGCFLMAYVRWRKL